MSSKSTTLLIGAGFLCVGAVSVYAHSILEKCGDDFEEATNHALLTHEEALSNCESLPIDQRSSCRVDANIDRAVDDERATDSLRHCQLPFIPPQIY